MHIVHHKRGRGLFQVVIGEGGPVVLAWPNAPDAPGAIRDAWLSGGCRKMFDVTLRDVGRFGVDG